MPPKRRDRRTRQSQAAAIVQKVTAPIVEAAKAAAHATGAAVEDIFDQRDRSVILTLTKPVHPSVLDEVSPNWDRHQGGGKGAKAYITSIRCSPRTADKMRAANLAPAKRS